MTGRRKARPRIVDGETVGVSPKVSWPMGLGLVAGVLVYIAGVDDEVAVTLVLAALGYGGVGAAAGPGEVVG